MEGISHPSQIIVDVINLSPEELAVYPYNSSEMAYLTDKHAECLELAKQTADLATTYPECTFHIVPLTI